MSDTICPRCGRNEWEWDTHPHIEGDEAHLVSFCQCGMNLIETFSLTKRHFEYDGMEVANEDQS